MSDVIPAQHESAIAVLREREAHLDSEIQAHSRALELATAQRELLLDLIATLSKKPRVRAPRPVPRPAPDPVNDPTEVASQRPSVFALPANDATDTEAAA
jgi:hypothetical protein